MQRKQLDYTKKLLKALQEPQPELMTQGPLPEPDAVKKYLVGYNTIEMPERRQTKGKQGKGKPRITKKNVSDILDIAMPTIGGIAGSVGGIGPGTLIGSYAGNQLRSMVKSKTGYGFNKTDAKNIAKTVATTGLDLLPSIAGFAGSSVSPLAGLAAQGATKMAREAFRYKTGLGKPEQEVKKKPSKARKYTGKLLDYAIPAGVAHLYNKFDDEDPSTGNLLGHVARVGVKKLTGLGKQKKGGRKLLSKENVGMVLDHAIPYMVSQTSAWANPDKPDAAVAGRVLGQVVRKGINSLTGVGKSGVGEYKPKSKRQSKPSDKRAMRADVLRYLMKEHGMSFVEASRNVTPFIQKNQN